MKKEPEILYENDHIIGVDKPVGLLVHADGSSTEDTLVDWLLARFPEIGGVGEEQRLRTGEVIERHGIVHRLDRDTSGVMVVARTQEAFEHLKSEFQERRVKKTYNTFVYGAFKEENVEGTIDYPIGKHKNDFRQWSAQRGARGKLREALTEYTVLKQGSVQRLRPAGAAPETGESVSFLEVFPKTGRTHQIRVHLKAIHHQVVCDPIYAENRPCLLGFNRLALHARRIELVLPDGEQVSIEAELPEDFKTAIDIIDKG